MRRSVSSGEHGSHALRQAFPSSESFILPAKSTKPTGLPGKLPHLEHRNDHTKSALKQQFLVEKAIAISSYGDMPLIRGKMAADREAPILCFPTFRITSFALIILKLAKVRGNISNGVEVTSEPSFEIMIMHSSHDCMYLYQLG